MILSSTTVKSKISNLPKSPGVYEFRDKKAKILYIGKATSLRDRVGSYFRGRFDEGSAFRKPNAKPSFSDRPHIEPMIPEIADIKIHETDSVLEALILEASLIKKHQPKYNVREKDDKSFAYAVITKEDFPRVLVMRETDLKKYPISNIQYPKIQNTKYKIQYTKIFGPYVSKRQLEIALKLIRKIFPYHSAKQATRQCCFDHQVGLCPGPYAGAITKKDYLKNIHGIEMILEGKKKKLLIELKRQMREFAKTHEFEKAAEARNRVFALEHIRDVALISGDSQHSMFGFYPNIECWGKIRIEAYDISNISGEYAVGSMVVFSGNKPDKAQYRKFKIKTVSGIDDVAMMREVLQRRFKNDWKLPDIIFIDGGKGHLNMAENVVGEFGHNIAIVAVAKGPTRKKLDIYYDKKALACQKVISDKKLVEKIREEAHRFAISYHKKLRRKNWKEK
ncbi:MAG: GIY-YIG nuclease family protein [Candidatus Moranbacteria bacterium]|nr:GIY-YIG nuclease family protein [Candidatus Moranbacteria bacterium]